MNSTLNETVASFLAWLDEGATVEKAPEKLKLWIDSIKVGVRLSPSLFLKGISENQRASHELLAASLLGFVLTEMVQARNKIREGE